MCGKVVSMKERATNHGGNAMREERMTPVDGLHVCWCGAKYWDGCECASCGEHWTRRPANWHNMECDGQSAQLAKEGMR